MRRMKYSGIEWIGEIPVDWVVCPLKRISDIQTGNTPNKDFQELYYSTTVGVPWIKAEDLGSEKSIITTKEYLTPDGVKVARVFPPNTVFVCCIASIGKVGFSTISCSCNQQINGIVFGGVYWKYGYYLTIAQESEYQFNASGNVVKILNSEKQSNIMCTLPSIVEQYQIVKYLDSKCSQIDSIIEKQEAIIEKLKEYKLSVITDAVTKGLDPNVEMKDSGVDVVRAVPDKWKVCRVKDVSIVERGGSPRPIEDYLTDSTDGINWIKIGDTVKGSKYITHVSQKIRKDGLSKTRFVNEGTLLLTNSMSFGEAYILCTDGCIHDGWLAFSDYKDIVIEFLYYFFISSFCRLQFELQVAGGVVQNLNIDKVKTTVIFLPSIEEQRQIASFLDSKIDCLNAFIEKKAEIIERLKLYKKSLIYEVVTGKKEV